jgi:hypothetical protein
MAAVEERITNNSWLGVTLAFWAGRTVSGMHYWRFRASLHRRGEDGERHRDEGQLITSFKFI